jgi:hypothetical protein
LGANKEAMLFAAAGLNLEKKEFSEKATWRNEEHCVLVCLASIVKSDGGGGMNGMNERTDERIVGIGRRGTNQTGTKNNLERKTGFNNKNDAE